MKGGPLLSPNGFNACFTQLTAGANSAEVFLSAPKEGTARLWQVYSLKLIKGYRPRTTTDRLPWKRPQTPNTQLIDEKGYLLRGSAAKWRAKSAASQMKMPDDMIISRRRDCLWILLAPPPTSLRFPLS